MICRKALFLAGLTLCVNGFVLGQVVISAQNGFWHEPSTWSGGVVPPSGAGISVVLNHDIVLTASVEVSHVAVAGSLTVDSHAVLDLLPEAESSTLRTDGGTIHIRGTVVGRDLVEYETSAANLLFDDGSTFHYRGGSRGSIPVATWHPGSTFTITGFAGSGYIAIAYSESWKQHFGNVIYDCPLQTSFVDLNGYLRHIHGDLIIRNTNNQSLRLSTTQRPVIQIDGDFRVEGPSEVWITTTSDSATVKVGRDFLYLSTSTGPSYMTTRGRCYMEVGGRFIMNSAGPLRISSGSVDSTGIRKTTFVLRNGLDVVHGGFIAPFPGKGVFVFDGEEEQEINVSASVFNGNIDLHFQENSTVDLNESEVRNTSGNVYVKGHLRLGSLHEHGALQYGHGGNIQVAGTHYYFSSAVLEYNGTASQSIGNAHPDNPEIRVILNNQSRTDLLKSITVRELSIETGWLNLNGHQLTATGDVYSFSPSGVRGSGAIRLEGGADQHVSLNASTIENLILSKAEGSSVHIQSPLILTGLAEIRSAKTTLSSQGNLVLASRSDTPGGTARVAPIPEGSVITGDVTVERFMSGEGRIYRYISSPVTNATVASLMDDFPVTGGFSDPSTGNGINASNPSLFYYDAADPASGWKPYPTSGYAHQNPLYPGTGYAAFIREGVQSTTWDVTGILNQGPISLPVIFDANAHEPYRGWNLSGNPYASPIVWGSGPGWERSSDISEAIAVRDNGEGRFRYTDGEVGDLPGGLIASSQAFWVRTSAPDAFLTVNERAKSADDAAFFRKAAPGADYLRLTLKSTNHHDETFLRIRHGSSRTFDKADASKMDNDHLNFSLLTDDGVSVAINAFSKFACQEHLQVRMFSSRASNGSMSPLQPGTYTLLAEGRGLFAHADLFLVDHFTGDTVQLHMHTFQVSTASGSSAHDRFSLIVESKPLGIVTAKLQPVSCDDETATITIVSNESVPYSVFSAEVADAVITASENMTITIPTTYLSKGTLHHVLIHATTFCERTTADTVVVYREPDPAMPAVHHASTCGRGSVVLSVDAEPGLNYSWYADELKPGPIMSGESYMETPELEKTRTYFVEATNSAGCRSPRVAVEARVVFMAPPDITSGSNGLFANNASTKWFYNGNLIHEGGCFLPPHSGLYEARIEQDNCEVRVQICYEYTLMAEVFPVPFNDYLKIISRRELPVWSLIIYDLSGRVVLENTSAFYEKEFDTRGFATGNYLVVVKIGKQELKVHAIKN